MIIGLKLYSSSFSPTFSITLSRFIYDYENFLQWLIFNLMIKSSTSIDYIFHNHFIYSYIYLRLNLLSNINWFVCFKDDLSNKKDASQSHTYLGPDYGAERAVDGKTETCMRTDAIGPTSPEKTVWWKVDLGGVYNIYSVNIMFRHYDGYGILPFTLSKKTSTCHFMIYMFIKLDKLLL